MQKYLPSPYTVRTYSESNLKSSSLKVLCISLQVQLCKRHIKCHTRLLMFIKHSQSKICGLDVTPVVMTVRTTIIISEIFDLLLNQTKSKSKPSVFILSRLVLYYVKLQRS